jgi:hypothetical protein
VGNGTDAGTWTVLNDKIKENLAKYVYPLMRKTLPILLSEILNNLSPGKSVRQGDKALKIGVPAKCSECGNIATWVIEIRGLDTRHIGVSKDENCPCLKFNLGEGWSACGEPFVLGDSGEKDHEE